MTVYEKKSLLIILRNLNVACTKFCTDKNSYRFNFTSVIDKWHIVLVNLSCITESKTDFCKSLREKMNSWYFDEKQQNKSTTKKAFVTFL